MCRECVGSKSVYGQSHFPESRKQRYFVVEIRQYSQDCEVWEIMCVGAHVRLCPTSLLPLFKECLAVLADDLHWHQELLNLKTGGEHDDVEIVLGAIIADDARLVESLDPLWDEFIIGIVETLEIVGIKYTSFTACMRFSMGG